MSDLSTQRVIVVTHATTIFGPPDALADYLKKQSAYFVYIKHPLTYDSNRQTVLEVWQGGQKINTASYPNWGGWAPINYLKDLWATIILVNRYRGKGLIDYYIGCDSLSVLPAIWFSPFWRLKQIVSYNVDYSPRRFASALLNGAYQLADKLATRHADYIWCVTERIAKIRKTQRANPQSVLVVSNGVHLSQVNSQGKHHQGLLFIGHLVKEKGLDQLIPLLAQLPKQRLTIYGEGPELSHLKQLVKDQGLTIQVTFAGHKSNDQILKLLPNYTIGLALYSKSESYVAYSDPMKVKEYLAAGLPVIVTDVPEVAQSIKKNKAGAVISDLAQLPEAVIMVADQIKTMRSAALSLGQNFDWSTIYTATFKQMKDN